MNKNYILNMETNKIELHFLKEEYQALSAEQKKEIKSAYLFSRCARAWVSRSTKNHYSAIRVAEKLGFTEREIKGEKLSYQEEIQQQQEKAERKIQRCEQYAENAEERAENLQSDFNKMRGDIAFLTQPIQNNAGGRAFKNYKDRIMNRFDKGIEEYRKSQYFLDKAESMQNTVDGTKFKNRTYLSNRIEECEKQIKRLKTSLEYKESKEDKNEQDIQILLQEIEYQIDKQAFLENKLEELGGVIYSKENIEKGYLVKICGTWGEVIKANKKTLEYKITEGGASGMVLKHLYVEIQDVKIPEGFEEKKDEIKNPYSKNDILVCYSVDGDRVIEAYQVIKTTPKGIQIQEIKIENNKPIRDNFISEKPCRKKIVKSKYSDFIGAYSRDWQLHKYIA